jgi:ABC-type multidrug transport system ATPase subunit
MMWWLACLGIALASESSTASFYFLDSIRFDNQSYSDMPQFVYALKPVPRWSGSISAQPFTPINNDVSIIASSTTPPKMGSTSHFAPGSPFEALAEGSTEVDASWFFLVRGFESIKPAPFEVKMRVMEIVEVAVEEWSTQFTAFTGQRVLFKITSNSTFQGQSAVRVNQVEPLCLSNLLIGCDRIPASDALSQARFSVKPLYVNETFWLRESCESLYVNALVTQDCFRYSIQVSRVLDLDVLVIEPGKEANYHFIRPEFSIFHVAVLAKHRSLKVVFRAPTLYMDISAAQGNFPHKDDPVFQVTNEDLNQATFYFNSPDLKWEESWFFWILSNVPGPHVLEVSTGGIPLTSEHNLTKSQTFEIPVQRGKLVCIEHSSSVSIEDVFPAVNSPFPYLYFSDAVRITCIGNLLLELSERDVILVRMNAQHEVVRPRYLDCSESFLSEGSFTFPSGPSALLIHSPGMFFEIRQEKSCGRYAFPMYANASSVNRDGNMISVDEAVDKWLVISYGSEATDLCQLSFHVTQPTVAKFDRSFDSVSISLPPCRFVDITMTIRCVSLVFIQLPPDVEASAAFVRFSKAVPIVVGTFNHMTLPYSRAQSFYEVSVYGGSELFNITRVPDVSGGKLLMIPALSSSPSGPTLARFFSLALHFHSDAESTDLTIVLPRPQVHKISSTKQVTIETSSEPQILEFPAEPDVYVLKTTLAIHSAIMPAPSRSNWLFGGGGFHSNLFSVFWQKEVGMKNNEPQWWYSRGSAETSVPQRGSFFLFVPSNSVPGTLTLEVEPVRYLCNPILNCHGNGKCSQDQLNDQCHCIEGAGFGFSGSDCSQKESPYAWAVGLVAFALLLLCYFLFWCIRLNRKRYDTAQEVNGSDWATLLVHSPTPMSIDVKDLCKDVRIGFWRPKSISLLKNVSVSLRTRELTAIMGPSGCGKSTLLKSLNGKINLTSGQLLVNGQAVKDLSGMSSSLGYVPQEDILRPSLSVWETVLFSSLLRLPRKYTYAQRREIALLALRSVGLENKLDLLVGDIGNSKLSGGQRKRVCVAIELAALPCMLFLDEPTSGLDSSTALSLMQMLKEEVIQELGIAVVTVIHQPRAEILALVDNLIVLNRGFVAYQGSTNASALEAKLPVLAKLKEDALNSNGLMPSFADCVLDHVDHFLPVSVDEEKDLHICVDEAALVALPTRALPHLWVQLWWQARRAFLDTFRDYGMLMNLYGLVLLISVLLSAMYAKSRFVGPASDTDIDRCPLVFQFLCSSNREDNFTGQASIIALAFGLAAAASSLNVFGGLEQRVFVREKDSGPSNLVYVLARELISLPNSLAASMLFVSIFQMITSTPISITVFVLWTWGIFYACSGAGYLFSVLASDSRALMLTVVFVAVMTAFSGAQPTLPALKNIFGKGLANFLTSLSYSRWSTESFYLAVLRSFQGIYSLDWSLEAHGYDMDEFDFSLSAPFLIGALLRLATVLVILISVSRRSH